MKTYKHLKQNFYDKSDVADYSKSFLVNAEDTLVLDKKPINCGIFFKLIISKKSQALSLTIELFSWSNEAQSYMPLEDSVWGTEQFGGGRYIETILKHYEAIIQNFFAILDTLKYHWQIKDMLYKLQHPSFIFHYKLLNAFSQKELEELCLKHYENHSIFNTALYQTIPSLHLFSYTFLPKVFNGFYLYEMEVSVDLDESDYPTIEDENSHIISKDEFMAKLKPH